MKSSRPVLAALTVCLLPLLSGVGAEELAHPFKRLALIHVTVVDVSNGELLTDRTVVIQGDRITAVGLADSVEIPTDARIVDGTGKYLIPGLWDMHVHLFNQLSGRPPNRWYFPLLVANGVTGVREMWTKPEDVPTLDRWRDRAAEGELVAPRIGAAGWLVDGPHSWWKTTDRVATADEARRFARQVHEADLDFVKVYSMLPREAFFALVEEATRLGLPVAGHVPLTVRVTEAADAGQRSNEHMHQVREACSGSEATIHIERSRLYGGAFTTAEDDSLWERHKGLWTETYDTSVCSTVTRKLADAGMWQVPTLVRERGHFLGPPEGDDLDSQLTYVPAEERRFWGLNVGLEEHTDVSMTSQASPAERRRRWEVTQEAVEVLARNGVPFLAGTDLGNPYVFPGFSLHTELELLVEAGLTPLQALQAATLEPARYLEATDSLGTVEPGKLGDLVLLDANPLDDITNTQRIAGVVLDGRYLDRAALDGLLAEAERAASDGHAPDVPPLLDELAERWEAAVNAGDFQAFLDLYAEQVVRFPPDGGAVRGRTAVREIEAPWFERTRLKASAPVTGGYVADDHAASWGHYRIEQTDRETGETVRYSGHWMAVHRREDDGQWRTHREIFTQVP